MTAADFDCALHLSMGSDDGLAVLVRARGRASRQQGVVSPPGSTIQGPAHLGSDLLGCERLTQIGDRVVPMGRGSHGLLRVAGHEEHADARPDISGLEGPLRAPEERRFQLLRELY